MIQSLLLLLLLSSDPALREETQLADCPADPVPGSFTAVVLRPPMDRVAEAGLKSRKQSFDSVVLLQHDAGGTVTHATFEKSSGDKRVDAAILKWAEGVKMQPGKCGFSKISAAFKSS